MNEIKKKERSERDQLVFRCFSVFVMLYCEVLDGLICCVSFVLIFSPISGSTVETSIPTTKETTSPLAEPNNNNNNNNTSTEKMLIETTGENGNETTDLANSTPSSVVVNTENDHSNNPNNY